MSWFGPNNSIILSFDYQNSNSFDDFEAQLQAIRAHYRFVKLGKIVDSLRKRGRQGLASIVLDNPRKGVMVRAVPLLLSMEIPFTLFLDADVVGLNRLPLREELGIYHEHYAEQFTAEDLKKWREKVLTAPQQVDQFLGNARRTLGPLPVNRLDPLQFFSTWGELLELPPELVEFGLNLDYRSVSEEALSEQTKFIYNQLKDTPRVGRVSNRTISLAENTILRKVGLEGIVGLQVGEVTHQTNPFELPTWKLL